MDHTDIFDMRLFFADKEMLDGIMLYTADRVYVDVFYGSNSCRWSISI